MKLEKTEKFILQVSFELVPESGDYIHACKACGRKAWRISEVKHAPRCSVAEVLRELGKVMK